MDSVRFSYDEFREYHRSLGRIADDVVVRMCIADYPAIKFANPERRAGVDGERRPFINQSMTARELPEDDELMRHALFSLGAYVVYPTESEVKKQLYVLHPKLIQADFSDGTSETMFAADHFSFIVNRHGVGARPLHFHNTVYVPTLSVPRKPRGVALHYPSPLPTSFDIPVPLTAASLQRSGIFDEGIADVHSDVLSTLFSRPFLIPSSPSQASSGGSSAKARRRARDAVVRERKASGSMRRFDDLWRELPIHSMLIVGLPHRVRQASGPSSSVRTSSGLATVTVIVTDRFKYSTAPLKTAAAFTIAVDSLHDDAVVEQRIAEALSSLSWESMLLQGRAPL